MKSLVKSVWATALRSGHYHQIRSFLHRGGPQDFCAMGVLCDLYRLSLPSGHERAETCWTATDRSAPYRLLDQTVVLPFAVQVWAGMQSTNGRLPGAVLYGHTRIPGRGISELNDNGADFKEIALIIETLGDLL
jgi:hypothetical protein